MRPSDEELRALLELETKVPEVWRFDKTSVRMEGLLDTVDIEPSIGVLHVYRAKNDDRRKAIGSLIVASRNHIRAIVQELLERRAECNRLKFELETKIQPKPRSSYRND